MRPRSELNDLLKKMLGNSNVYFQPPESMKLKYPCIVYKLGSVNTDHANNKPYRIDKIYELTVIDKNPDSAVSDRVAMLQGCAFDRSYTYENLNHWVYNIYF